MFLPKRIGQCESMKTYRWITFHRRGLPQSQSSTREKIWPNKQSCRSVCEEHSRAADNSRMRCGKDTRFVREAAV